MSTALSADRHSASDVVRLLGLEPLDREGGFFRRIAESPLTLPDGALPPAFGGDRRAYSSIYLLLTPEGFSALHRLAQDELWFFLAGDPVDSLRLAHGGHCEWVRLGADPAAGQRLHDVVAAGTWQGTRLVAGGRWALCAMVVVPEFIWRDFELGDRSALSAAYPERAADIAALTRN